jgi:hypothetical protein
MTGKDSEVLKNWRIGFSCVVFTSYSVIAIMIAVSKVFEEPTLILEDTLISTFGVGMAIFGLAITLVPFRKTELWAWWVLWYWPVLLLIHVLVLDTWLPDLPLVILAIAALLLPFRSFFSGHLRGAE